MTIEPIWSDYVTYDADGYISGIKEDAPQEAKDAYAEYIAEKEAYIAHGVMMPK